MTRLTDFIEDTMDDYFEAYEDAEAIKTKIKELVESRGIDLVLGWTKAKPLVPMCLALLSLFCADPNIGSPNASQVSY
jgi:hypothetical protein